MPRSSAVNAFDEEDALDSEAQQETLGPSAAQINTELLEAMATNNARQVQRVLEQHANIWLDSDFSSDGEWHVQPILFAMSQPWPCEDALNALDDGLGGVRSWAFEGLLPIHVAVAHKNEWALRWCLRDEGSILDKERVSSRNRIPSTLRTALAVSAQMGDPGWLRTVLEATQDAINERSGRLTRRTSIESMDQLRALDQQEEIPALLLALFELGSATLQASAGRPVREGADWRACAQLLHQWGFSADSTALRSKVPAAMLIAAQARSPLGQEEPGECPPALSLARLRSVVELAFELGAAGREQWIQKAFRGSTLAEQAQSFSQVGLFTLAGACLDPQWRDNLLACGFTDNAQHGSWCLGLAQRMHDNLKKQQIESFDDRNQGRTLLRTLETAESTWALPLSERPLRGLERDCLPFFFLSTEARRALYVPGTPEAAHFEQLQLRMDAAPKADFNTESASTRTRALRL